MTENLKISTIIENLKNLTLIELNELIKEIEKVFGINTNQIISTTQSNSSQKEEQKGETEEKKLYTVNLVSFPEDKKIAVLKTVRSVTGFGLKESKEIVDNIPKLIKENITKEESEKIKKEFELVNGKVEIK